MSENRNVEEIVLYHLQRLTDRNDITLEFELLGEDGISSIEAMELLSGLENEFKITITPRSLRNVSTASDLIELIKDKC